MPNLRPLACAALLGLSGCIAYPVPVVATAPAREYVGAICAAGFYQCAAPPAPAGTPCSCPGLGAPSYGAIR